MTESQGIETWSFPTVSVYQRCLLPDPKHCTVYTQITSRKLIQRFGGPSQSSR